MQRGKERRELYKERDLEERVQAPAHLRMGEELKMGWVGSSKVCKTVATMGLRVGLRMGQRC